MDKIWQVAPAVQKEISDKFPEINPIVLQLLINREINTQEKIDSFLNTDYGQDLHDPFLFQDMQKAVARILKAIENKEKIVVYGDYDADGVCSSVIMVESLKALGGEVEIYIPYRETEGYGLNEKAVAELARKGTGLVITVDCGIANKNEVKTLTDKKVDVIITDHHQELAKPPKAFAIINPNVKKEKYPFKGLTGAGIAFKVAQALVKEHSGYKVNQLQAGWEKWLLDIAAIGTVADMQPILDENRVIVKYGLIVLQKTKRLGLHHLFKSMRSDLGDADEKTIGWQIAPRLNAAGRLNHASSAYQLLITGAEKEAKALAAELAQTNTKRQELTERIKAESKNIIGEDTKQKLLSVVGDNWPTGVLGLVSGRLTDEFNRPSLVISKYRGEIIGSGRSIPEFNIVKALEKCDQYLSRYGGHPQACGFTLKDEVSLNGFVDKMKKLAEIDLSGKEISPRLDIDAEIELENVNWELFVSLEKFTPYGEKNPKPK
ncbi:single-stranded-DNA-specific exonuclease RecJ, partial [Candidatus Falkowbacteria bacterium]|nr:single-stranded-DNA-specific exonuclease RecJ [Candidatus Falkowbacteria bacterium]